MCIYTALRDSPEAGLFPNILTYYLEKFFKIVYVMWCYIAGVVLEMLTSDKYCDKVQIRIIQHRKCGVT